MKLFTYPVKQLSSLTSLDYLKELDCRIDSLNEYLEKTNPNWHLLNTMIGEKPFATNKELVDSGIIKLGLLYHNNEYQIITILCVAKLKLHQGLSQIYGDQCYYWFFSDADWPTYILQQNLELKISTTIKEQFNHYYYDFTGELPSESYQIWVTNNEFSAINYAFLYEPQTSFKIYQNSDNTGSLLVLQNNNSKLLIPNDLVGKIDNPYIPILAAQGYNIFCNYIEENDSQNIDNQGRQNIINYQILPVSVTGDIVIPTTLCNIKSGIINWSWQYVSKGITKYGTDYVFHLPSGPLRLFYHSGPKKSNIVGTYALDLLNASNFINGFSVNESKIIPLIANANKTLWNGRDDQVICSKIIHNISENPEFSFQEEEIICDESLKLGDTVFANYKIPYYNITVENMVDENSSRPNMQWYLTMI